MNNTVAQVVHIRLINGDEIIGALKNHGEFSTLIENPLVIETVTAQDGTPRTVMNNYIPFADKNSCEFTTDHIITIIPVNSEVARYYSLSKQLSEIHKESILADVKKTNEAIANALDNQVKHKQQEEEQELDQTFDLTSFSSNTKH